MITYPTRPDRDRAKTRGFHDSNEYTFWNYYFGHVFRLIHHVSRLTQMTRLAVDFWNYYVVMSYVSYMYHDSLK
jgi:hypothetical protein